MEKHLHEPTIPVTTSCTTVLRSPCKCKQASDTLSGQQLPSTLRTCRKMFEKNHQIAFLKTCNLSMVQKASCQTTTPSGSDTQQGVPIDFMRLTSAFPWEGDWHLTPASSIQGPATQICGHS